MLSKEGEIRRDDACLDFAGRDVILFTCHGGKGNQEWSYDHDTMTVLLPIRPYFHDNDSMTVLSLTLAHNYHDNDSMTVVSYAYISTMTMTV